MFEISKCNINGSKYEVIYVALLFASWQQHCNPIIMAIILRTKADAKVMMMCMYVCEINKLRKK